MVALNRIYTRTGDDGTTGLIGQERRSKADIRVEAIGAVDETNAAIGLARQSGDSLGEIDTVLAAVQNDLFDLGADLATLPEADATAGGALRVSQQQIERLEREIDRLNEALEPLRSFVLPGGSTAAAALHFARTVARRAERNVVALAAGETVNPHSLGYLNRLSDLLFVIARWTNQQGAGDVLWVPGQHR